MAAESKHEQILAALASSMAAISGASYHYPAPTVVRVPWFDDQMLDASLVTLYLLRPGDENHTEEATGSVHAEAEVFALLAKRFEPSSEDPFTGDTPLRVTIVNRLVRDFLLKLWTDVQLGGALGVDNISDGSLYVDRARMLPGWALAEVRFVIRYSYRKDAP